MPNTGTSPSNGEAARYLVEDPCPKRGPASPINATGNLVQRHEPHLP